MGAGISLAAGMRQAGVQETIFAVIGDSTFFHAGMSALLNLVYNDAKVCVIILDNQIVAMTGHQPTPETGIQAMGGRSKTVRIEDVVRALGVERVEVVDPYNIEVTKQVLKEVLNYEGPSVIISKRPCALLVDRGVVREVTEECTSCGVCTKILGCPAIVMTAGGVEIDIMLCRGCGVCETICPHNSIRRVK
jgi:indolepyruvate ferredoxin oxidoreductase alpha subunit